MANTPSATRPTKTIESVAAVRPVAQHRSQRATSSLYAWSGATQALQRGP